VAEAALLRPPFFGLDLIDLVAGSIEGDPPTLTAARERREHARAVIRDLRFQRFSRPAIQTALDVIERTALGRTVAVGPNGPQALRTLYEVAFQLGRLATEKGLDYDGVTREMRSWIDRPVHVDPPDASGPDTVRVMTIHQAKGLEFPAVVMWDGFAEERGRSDATWLLSRTGDGIALAMDRFQAELPHGAGLLALDTQLASAERRRLFFVAMTRARDLLVVPEPQAKPGGKMLPKIMEGLDESIVERLELYREHEPPAWAGAADEVRPMPVASDEVGATCETARHTVADGVAIATTPIAVPTAVTTAAKEMRGPEHAVRQEESDASLEDEGTETDTARERARKTESSRYGTTFGSTVHRALQLVLEGTKGTVAEIVTRAAQEYHLTEHVDEAGADVDRALRAIEALAGGTLPGTTPGAAPPFAQVEYPICMAGENGTLLLGSIDLVLVQKDEVVIVDFKTDAPPASNSSASAYPAYRRQLELYAEALETGKLAGDRPVRLGLLFTASGEMAWVN
jgi:ATP-dependent helicase/nuclease subunit A